MNAIVVDDAIRFVSQKSKENLNELLLVAMQMKVIKKDRASLIIMKTKIS